MKCPFCSAQDTKVLDTRNMDSDNVVRRRRMCETCGNRFTTYERIESIPLIVIKSDNKREKFDRSKLLKGIMLACNKRPVSMEQIEKVVSDVENKLYSSSKKEFKSSEIGQLVMEQLRNLDEVSYVRFASVYRKFKDIDSFMNELAQLLDERKKN